LNPQIYQWACSQFQMRPQVDLFANFHNRQCRKFCSWAPHPKALGNAFSLQWGTLGPAWMNPPWEIIPQCLDKVKQDRAQVLACLPVWESAPWWRCLMSMVTEPPLVLRDQPLFVGPDGSQLPPPRWATLLAPLQG
jgi:hypothetical protein